MSKNWKIAIAVLVLIILASVAGFFTYRHFSAKQENTVTMPADSTQNFTLAPSNTLNTPHGDTALIPVLTDILNRAFEAGRSKDYPTLATLIVYRGPDASRHGTDVFRQKNNYEKGVVRLTGETFAKWSAGATSIDYPRIFQLPQPDGRTLEVLEVIFVYPKRTERRFFGFLKIENDYKIADVTSWL